MNAAQSIEIALIAHDYLGIETLVARNRDSLDFHERHVDALRRALTVAYEAGQRSATKQAKPISRIRKNIEGEQALQRGF